MGLRQILDGAYTQWAKVTTGNFVVVNEEVVLVDKTSGAATQITLPPALAGGARRVVFVVDDKGDASTNPITVIVAGSGTISGATSYVINTNGGAAAFIDAEDEWNVLQLGGASGVAAGGMAYINTAASGAVGGTSAETLFDTNYSIPANRLKVGTVIKTRFQGIATTQVGSDTVAIKLYIGGIGGTTLISMAATAPTSGGVFQGEYELVVRAVGATGTIVGCGTYKSVPGTEGTMTIKDDILAATSINTQAPQVVGVSATWNTSNANSARLDVLAVEIFG